MKPTDKYHRWVSWSEEDQCYIGRCPDLFSGGVHDDDPLVCAKKLQHAIDDIETDYAQTNQWPPVTVKPSRELAY